MGVGYRGHPDAQKLELDYSHTYEEFTVHFKSPKLLELGREVEDLTRRLLVSEFNFAFAS